MTDWDTPLGARLTRKEIADKYGGAFYGGIEPSGSSPNVIVYTDPAVGGIYGYNFDGWAPDMEAFYYTGEGRSGPQRMTDGNAAILHHVDHGRSLRLFEATAETVKGSKTKVQEYLGEFAVDVTEPVRTEDALDREGEIRTVFVFKLRPVGRVQTNSASQSGVVDTPVTTSQLVDVEANTTEQFERAYSEDSIVARRREGKLVADYRAYLEGLGHTVKRNKLTSPQTVKPIWTDLFDVTDSVLYEAKASATRPAIRMAIGQLFDYRRYLNLEEFDLSVLLPARPNDEMIDLLSSLGIGMVFQERPGVYKRGPVG